MIGLLYTILILFAYQGHSIIHNLGPVFRVFVPQILYFVIMWNSTFFFIYYLSRREGSGPRKFGYEMAVVQAFTAASNNFVRWHTLQTTFHSLIMAACAGTCYCRSHCGLWS